MEVEKVPVAVLVSGNGTNLQALLNACADPAYPARIVKVISNVPGVRALERAEAAGVPAVVVDHRGRSRQEFEKEMLGELEGVEWVALAGFMRVLSPQFLEAFPGRILNVHPALLPAFPGLHAVEQAIRAGVTQAGCTVHLVDAGTDTGPILCQGTCPVYEEDDASRLSARIHLLEHVLYPMALAWAVEGRVFVEDGRARVVLRDGEKRWWVELDQADG